MEEHQRKLAGCGLKMGTAQWFRLANLERIFINLSWYDITRNTPNQYSVYSNYFPGMVSGEEVHWNKMGYQIRIIRIIR